MIIETLVAGPFETNAYLVGCEEEREAIVIDPGYGSAEHLTSIAHRNGLTIKAIFLTHSHFDHIADVKVLKETLNIPVYVAKEDALNLERPGSDGLPNVFALESVVADYLLNTDESYSVGSYSFVVLPTPGHSPGSVCFYFEKESVLFSGDTLFQGSYGNVSFPTSDVTEMGVSLKKLAKLPEETVVYPGHGDKTTVGREKGWIESYCP